MDIKEALMERLRDPLHKNALYLMMNSLCTSGLGFIFWIIVARYYSLEEVGLASAIISMMTLFAILANLGFGIGLIRYIPTLNQKESSALMNSCLLISGFFSLLLATIFILGLDLWSPKLVFIRENILYIASFLVFTLIAVNTALLNSVFVARKSAKYVFYKDSAIFSSLKILFPVFFISLGSYGIFASWGIALIVAFIFAVILFLPKIQNRFNIKMKIERRLISQLLHFSLGNHVGEIFRMLPALVLPIIILNVISSQDAAYFYIAWMISNLLFMVSLATTTSLLAESSESEKGFEENSKKSLKFIFLFLMPVVIFILFFGDRLLFLIGSEYSANAYGILRLLSFSSIPFAFNTVYITIKRIEKKVKEIIVTYGTITLMTFILIILFIEELGLESVGYAWLISQTVLFLFIIIPLKKKLS